MAKNAKNAQSAQGAPAWLKVVVIVLLVFVVTTGVLFGALFLFTIKTFTSFAELTSPRITELYSEAKYEVWQSAPPNMLPKSIAAQQVPIPPFFERIPAHIAPQAWHFERADNWYFFITEVTHNNKTWRAYAMAVNNNNNEYGYISWADPTHRNWNIFWVKTPKKVGGISVYSPTWGRAKMKPWGDKSLLETQEATQILLEVENEAFAKYMDLLNARLMRSLNMMLGGAARDFSQGR